MTIFRTSLMIPLCSIFTTDGVRLAGTETACKVTALPLMMERALTRVALPKENIDGVAVILPEVSQELEGANIWLDARWQLARVRTARG
jgi:hypothetical protein